MPSITRRRLLGAGAAAAVGAGVVEQTAGPSPTFDATPPDPGSWPMPRYGPRNTGHNPHAAIPRSDPGVAWRTDAGTDVEALAVADETVFAAGSHGVVALDADDGRERWRALVSAATLCVHDGTVVAVSGEVGKITAIDAASGEVAWRWERDGSAGHAVIAADGTVYAGLHGVLAAFDAATGDRRWEVDLGGLGRVGAAVADGRLYAGGPGPTEAHEPRRGIDAVRHAGPRLAWSADGPSFGYPPAVADGRVFAGSEAMGSRDEPQAVYAHDAASGDRLWATPVARQTLSPVVADGRGFVAATEPRDTEQDDGRLVALDLDSGDERWRVDLPNWAGRPVVAGGVVAVGVYGSVESPVAAFDAASGDRLWTRRVGGDSHRLAAVDGTLYVGTRQGPVYALRDE
jgi:outer membrane protein assembly factor BamB